MDPAPSLIEPARSIAFEALVEMQRISAEIEFVTRLFGSARRHAGRDPALPSDICCHLEVARRAVGEAIAMTKAKLDCQIIALREPCDMIAEEDLVE